MIRFRVGLGHLPKARHATPCVFMGSRDEITPDDAMHVLDQLDSTAWDTAWHFIQVQPGSRYASLFGSRGDHFAVATPDTRAALGPPMEEEYLDWEFTVLWPDRTQSSVQYRDMIRPCVMAGQLMNVDCAWCPGCARNGITDCRIGWLLNHLVAHGREAPGAGLLSYRDPWEGPLTLQIPVTARPSYSWVRRQHEHLASRRDIPPELDYVSGYYTRPWTLDSKWLRTAVACRNVDLSAEGVQRRRDEKSAAASDGAVTARRRASICQGCVLEFACNYSGRYDRCINFKDDAVILTYIQENMAGRGISFIEDDVIEKSAAIGGEEFMCASPDTYRDRQAVFGGYLRGKWQVSTTQRGSVDATYAFKTWLELRHWVRKWAPDALPKLDYAEKQAGTRTFTDWQRAMFMLGSQRADIRLSAGFGYVRRSVIALSVDARFQGITMELDGGRYCTYLDLTMFLERYGWDPIYLPAPPRALGSVWAAESMKSAVRAVPD